MAKTEGGKKKVFRKKEKKNIPVGIAYIAASFNNTLISITDTEGNLVAQSSSGARGFRGSPRNKLLLKQRDAPWKPACNSAKSASRDQVAAANLPFGQSTTRVFG